MPPVADPISNNKSHHTTRNIQESGDDCHGESFQDAFFILPSAHRRAIGVRLFNREGLDAFEDMGEELGKRVRRIPPASHIQFPIRPGFATLPPGKQLAGLARIAMAGVKLRSPYI